MAGIVDVLMKSTGEQLATSGDNIQGSVNKGIALAQHIENLQQQKQELELKKDDLGLRKVNAAVDAVSTGLTKVPKKAQAAYFKSMRENIGGKLGVNMSDEFFQALTSPDVNQGAIANTMVQFREAVKRAQATKDFSEAKALAQPILEAMEGDVVKFGDFLNTAVGNETTAWAQKESLQEKQKQFSEEPARTVDTDLKKKVNAEFVRVNEKGGLASVDARLKKLDNVIEKMESGKIKTGKGTKLFPFVNSDSAQAIIDPDYKAASDDVKSAIEIKSILDSQFSDKAMMEVQKNLGIDGALPTKLNIERMKALRDQLKNGRDDKVNLFREQGLPVNAKPAASVKSTPTPDWKAQLSAKKANFQALPTSGQEKVIQSLSQQYKVSPDEIRKALGK